MTSHTANACRITGLTVHVRGDRMCDDDTELDTWTQAQAAVLRAKHWSAQDAAVALDRQGLRGSSNVPLERV
jgi:hypothetical protein